MFGNVVRIVLALVYLYAGAALLLGRKRFREEGKAPNLVIPAVLLVLACITTLANW
ncbi:hypothetical protein K8S17_05810 [bacterium]|nr:hypothetical protein [bacterium]